MNAAKELFDTLAKCKVSEHPQKQLLEYCNNALSGVERVHVDFKEKSDSSKSDMDPEDQKNVAKAVSGFANSGGGVLIWGVEDKSLCPKPISDVDRFLSSMLELAPHVTDPVVGGIDGDCIPEEGSADGAGFALLFIPESQLPPHRVILKESRIQGHYYVRSGSSFVRASHVQLEDMFGRRPKPKLNLRITGIKEVKSTDGYYTAFFALANDGRGMARSPAVLIELPKGIKGGRPGGGFLYERTSNRFSSNGRVAVYETDWQVIHSGLDIEFQGLKIAKSDFPPGSPITLKCSLHAEGVQAIVEDVSGQMPR
ncbi:MAG: ATP-binding protein [Armatimonadetes bacterium]|nr:ATP-binding protein [Armatimonadota bacterium]